MEDESEKIQIRENWAWTKINQLGLLINGDRGKNYPSKKDYVGSGIPFINAGHLLNGRISVENMNFISEEKYKSLNNGKLVEGDIIYCLRGTLGKCAIFSGMKAGAIASSLVILRLNKEINHLYIYYFLISPLGKNLIKVFDNGTAQPNLSAQSVSNYSLPLAPLPEQRAIVSKIEQLFSELDNGISNLKLAKEQLKVYRQAVLKKAFEGELTKKWREQQTDLPDAKDLLEQIRKEREEAVKVSGKKVKPLRPLTEEELEKLPKLPEKWYWVKNEELIHYVTSGSRDWKQFYSEKGAYFIRTQDIKTNSLSLEEVAFVDLPDKVEGKRSLVEKDDLLMTITGANVGKVAYINFEIPEAYVSQSVALMKYVDKRIVPFLHYYFQTYGFGATLINNLVYGMGRPVLSLENMREVPVSLCSLSEQRQIIQEIETRLSVCDKIEQDIETNLERAEALRQSILKKAFEGKLLNEKELAEVRSAEDWEPAEVLLERIKAEKEGNVKKEKQATEKLKSIIHDDNGLTSQATLQVFEQIDK